MQGLNNCSAVIAMKNKLISYLSSGQVFTCWDSSVWIETTWPPFLKFVLYCHMFNKENLINRILKIDCSFIQIPAFINGIICCLLITNNERRLMNGLSLGQVVIYWDSLLWIETAWPPFLNLCYIVICRLFNVENLINCIVLL